MTKLVYVVGIDVSKDSLQVCLKVKALDNTVKIKGSRSFTNDYKGFEELIGWVDKHIKSEDSQIIYLMEATGSYYEDLAYCLYENGQQVSVVLANKMNHFAKSLNIKTKTDKVDAALIAQYGIEREAILWKPMSPEFRLLRDLCRERLSLTKQNTRAKCQLHAMEHSHLKSETVVKLKNSQIEFYESSIEEIETEIKEVIDKDQQLKERLEKVITIKGVGLVTAITVLCETNGFQTFSNIRQVVSYAGLDVVMKESGNFKGKTKISKKGNSRIRQVLYMPALSSTKYNDKIKDLYKRIVEKNPNLKRKGIVAGMRKLLILIYLLWTRDEVYNPDHQWKAGTKAA
jgi:transposase